MDKINNLNQTVGFMLSDDYKERFIAEYAQLKIRYSRLERVLAQDCFELTCPIEMLEEQLVFMRLYIKILVKRAKLEGIILPEV